jgi:hypothetical protein
LLDAAGEILTDFQAGGITSDLILSSDSSAVIRRPAAST